MDRFEKARQCVLVTGANGFVGLAVCSGLISAGLRVRAALRDETRGRHLPAVVEKVAVGSLDAETDWSDALAGVDAVVHLAGRVHVMRDRAADPLSEFRRVNVEATRSLAQMAATAGVQRLVYVSTAKVNGEGSGRCYCEADEPRPHDPYAQSKFEAETALRCIEAETGLEVVVLRPPLIYGPGVRANFLRILQLVETGMPLPLASIRNRRSMIFLDNFVAAVIASLASPAPVGKTYLVSDGVDISTPELIHLISATMGKNTTLFPVPPIFLRLLGKAIGKSSEVKRLCGSFCVDSGKFREELGWKPPFSTVEGVRQTVDWFMRDSLRR